MFQSGIFGQILVNALITGSIYAVIAFGFTLMYSTMNFFNMAYGAHVLIGAYAFYSFYRLLHLPIVISGILACFIVIPVLLLTDRAVYFPLRKKNVPGWSIVVVSMSINLIVESIVSMAYGNAQQFVLGGAVDLKKFSIGGAGITIIQLSIILIAVLVMLGFTVFLKKTKIGLIIRAIANDKQMSYVVGIDVEKAYTVIIAVSAILSTVAAVLMSLESDVRPRMGSPALLKAIMASIIGRVGNIKGALLAGYLFGIIENIAVFYLGTGWRDAICLPIVIILLLIFPSYFGIAEQK